MASRKVKQKLADELAEEAAGIDIETLQGGAGKRQESPERLTPEEQQAREQAFTERFASLGASGPQAPNTLSPLDTVALTDTVASGDIAPPLSTHRVPANRQPKRRKEPTILKSASGDTGIAGILARNGNRPVTLDSGYTAVLWTVDDVLALHQTPAEQTVYRHLYRLAYGFGNTHCFVGYEALRRRCHVATNTLRKALSSLGAKQHIAILENVNTRDYKATVYRVFLPEEIEAVQKEATEYQGKVERRKGHHRKTLSAPATVSPPDTVSLLDTASQCATGSNTAPSNGDTVSDFDTTRTEQKTRSRTDKDLEPASIVGKASSVGRRSDRPKALVSKDNNPQKLSESDEDYIYNRPSSEQGEIFRAQTIWEKWYPELPLPIASQLNDWLEKIREQNLDGEQMDAVFENTLKTTKERDPRDVVGWLVKGFREGYLIDPSIL